MGVRLHVLVADYVGESPGSKPGSSSRARHSPPERLRQSDGLVGGVVGRRTPATASAYRAISIDGVRPEQREERDSIGVRPRSIAPMISHFVVKATGI